MPDSKRDDIVRRYQTDSERVEAVVKEWRAHHPAPSWKGLATALYGRGELRALRRLYGKYLTGVSCDLMNFTIIVLEGLCVQLGLSVDYTCSFIHEYHVPHENNLFSTKVVCFNIYMYMYIHACTCVYMYV